MNKVTIGLIIAIALIVLTFAGLLPLPGQKDNVTPYTQPSPPAPPPLADLPQGPSPSPPEAPGVNPPAQPEGAAGATARGEAPSKP